MDRNYEFWETSRLLADIARHEGLLAELAVEVDLEELQARLIRLAIRQEQPTMETRSLVIRCLDRFLELETFDYHGYRLQGDTASEDVMTRDGQAIRPNAAKQLVNDLRWVGQLIDVELLRYQFTRDEDDSRLVCMRKHALIVQIFGLDGWRTSGKEPGWLEPWLLVLAAKCIQVVADEIRTMRQGFTIQPVWEEIDPPDDDLCATEDA